MPQSTRQPVCKVVSKTNAVYYTPFPLYRCCDKPSCRHKGLDEHGVCKNLTCRQQPSQKAVWGDVKIALMNIREAQINTFRMWLQHLEELYEDMYNTQLPNLALQANVAATMQRFRGSFALSQPVVNVRYACNGDTITTIMKA